MDNIQKLAIMEEVYNVFDLTMCMIFINSKKKALKIQEKLHRKGISVEVLLGGAAMSDDERKSVV
jgi:superfamily II DNA/RNA helicase